MKEERILAYWKKNRRGSRWAHEPIPDFIMHMAQLFKTPCAEIRRIVGWPSPSSPAYRDFEEEERQEAANRKEEKRFAREKKWAEHNLKRMLE